MIGQDSKGAFNLSPKKRAILEAFRQQHGLDASAILPIERNSSDPLPLSFAQQRLWFLNQLTPGSIGYNMPLAFQIRGPLNVTALQLSLSEVMSRHEALRTHFILRNGSPVQRVAPAEPFALPVVDLCHLPESEREAKADQLAREEGMCPFDLTRDLLLRAKLLRLGAEHYAFLCTMHHIASDGWSMGVFMRELTVLYQAFLAGKPSLLSELPIQYADFAVWQREWLMGETLDRQLIFWKQQIAGLAPLDLPIDRPRPVVQSYRGAREWLVLPKALRAGLRELSRREGATLFMVLLAAFKVLLRRYSGQEDIVVGSPIANRNRAEIEGLIGFFVNSLVMRTDCSGDPTFCELLGRVREATLEAYAHPDLPFEKLVEELEPERDLSRNPLFQVMFALQNAPRSELQLAALTVEPFRAGIQTTRFDLETHCWETPEGLCAVFVYNTDIFEAATISRMSGHFQTLLEGIVSDPAQRLSRLPILTGPEMHQLLAEWNSTKREYPSDKCIHEIFERQTEISPDAVAAVYRDQRLTYGELNSKGNQLAHYLRKLGMGPESLVGICVERSLEMAVGLLGILMAGGAYVPLDPDYPKDRLAFILSDAQVTVVLTQARWTDKLTEYGGKVVCLDTDWDAVAGQPNINPEHGTTPESLAYVIYTSGSTGIPKGVLISHSNVVRLFDATRAWFQFDKYDVWTLFHSYAFDFSVWELWGALLYGGRVVVVPFETSRSPTDFYQLLGREKVTVLNQTPSAFRQLIRADEENTIGEKLSLRLVIFGGEALDVQSLQPWIDRHRDRQPQLVNMYGITETTVHVTYRPLRLEDVQATGRSPIGKPIPDLQVYVLDAELNLVPIGVPGEMYVGGPGLARGYLDRPEQTAERFLPNPFCDKAGARLYKTGDRARYLSDGNIEFLGRIDHQVKIRGFRIELGEIESALGQHPAIREAVVVLCEESTEDKALVAYFVCHDSQVPSVSDLRNFLQEQLPNFMMPAAFVRLEALPLTTNGKVDRQSLPSPGNLRPELETAYVAPRNELEQTITALWQNVLKVEKIGVHDNFFDLGGHSLLLAEAHAKLKTVIREDFPMVAMFQFPTISSLANHLSQDQANAPSFQQSRDRAETRRQFMELQTRLKQKVRAAAQERRGVRDE